MYSIAGGAEPESESGPMAAVQQLLAALDLDPDVISYLVDCLGALGGSPSTDDVAEVLAPFADELEMSNDDAKALAEDVVATLAAPGPTGAGASAAVALEPASEPAPAPQTAPSAGQSQPGGDPMAAAFADESLPYGGDWNAAMAAKDRDAVRLILEHRDRVADAEAVQAREERAAQLAQQQQAQQQQQQQQQELQEQEQQQVEERRIDPADGNAYTLQDFIDAYGGTAQWDAIGAQPQGYRKPDLADEFPTMGKTKTKKKNKQRQPEPEPEPKGLSGNAK